jgi:hypothetical protein
VAARVLMRIRLGVKKSKKWLGIAIENSTAAGNISSQSGNFEVLGGISHRIGQ